MKIVVFEDRAIHFKGNVYLPGDVIDMEEKDANRLLNKGFVETVVEKPVMEKTRPPALTEMTIAELKSLLDTLCVSYGEKTVKADLISLVEKNSAEPEAD